MRSGRGRGRREGTGEAGVEEEEGEDEEDGMTTEVEEDREMWAGVDEEVGYVFLCLIISPEM